MKNKKVFVGYIMDRKLNRAIMWNGHMKAKDSTLYCIGIWNQKDKTFKYKVRVTIEEIK